ncbi:MULTISPECIES: ABC transporter substrate-binding protein [unclassified Curtobacterium]|uniref:ABC transporter substrate-binding protein n=1 Tax=unclassified Curtobacterium TaxID=257496 RepID=UPI000F4A986F|nr:MULTISPECIES: ABC transporter substrate-binding protein [unclassified Curtobacterium]ROQ17475.1 osmoprotectant transport system substrate-binding protein [Curtobacterium sp. PhB171]ROQ29280.1 osmoprotectant transport system substrate-binding protein [Curtobacterium sp. PhB170]ROS45576.1 osmoprotectant transport system substrate-binding protein [Curtobacterium sp. PhB131]ROS68122.1 osmoprotectant transport system substrate-binding protein [Curtobacterium sp. PhB141]
MFTAGTRTRILAGVIAVGAIVALSGCSTSDPTKPASGGGDGSGSTPIVVGSFNFPESEILGSMYALVLKDAGFDVTTKFNLGPRQTTIPALKDGSINLMPEYNGNLLFFYDTKATAKTTAEVDAALKTEIPKDFQVLEPSPAEDKDAYVVTQAEAEKNGLTSIGDLSKIEPFSLGANPQFGTLPYGIPGLKSRYGVDKVTFKSIEDYGGPDTVKALVDDTVQVADIYTTSPDLVTKKLLVLKDPENLIASQNILPFLNKDIYSAKLASTLNKLSEKLTTDDLIELRNRVEGSEKAQAQAAAKDWLTKEGLLK